MFVTDLCVCFIRFKWFQKFKLDSDIYFLCFFSFEFYCLHINTTAQRKKKNHQFNIDDPIIHLFGLFSSSLGKVVAKH